MSELTKARFLALRDVADSCWPWRGHIDPGGYGRFRVGGSMERAHRVAYQLFVGPIPPGLQIDHLCHTLDEACSGGPSCRHRRCVNPAHLQPVTSRENTFRGRTIAAENAAKACCKNGHELTAENVYRISPSLGGGRACRTCRGLASRRYKARSRGTTVR